MIYDIRLISKNLKLRHDADLVCAGFQRSFQSFSHVFQVGEIHDSASDHAVQRLLIDALTPGPKEAHLQFH